MLLLVDKYAHGMGCIRTAVSKREKYSFISSIDRMQSGQVYLQQQKQDVSILSQFAKNMKL
jgi:hypothetical protein